MSVLSLYLPVCLSVLFLYLSECLFPFQRSAHPFVGIRNGLKVAFSSISPGLGKIFGEKKVEPGSNFGAGLARVVVQQTKDSLAGANFPNYFLPFKI